MRHVIVARFQGYCYLNVTTVEIYKPHFQFIVVIKGKMSLQSRFRVDSPTYINQLCITDEFLVASTSGGLVAILNTKCQHATPVLSEGEWWDIACYGKAMVTANDDSIVRLWSLESGFTYKRFQ